MAKGWIPILPKVKLLIDSKKRMGKAKSELSTFGSDLLRACKDYEAPSPDPSVYIRRNILRKSWAKEGPRKIGNTLEVAVISSGKVAPYNVYVKGPKRGAKGKRQAKHMARRGWLSIDDIFATLWPRTRRKLQSIMGRA